MASEHSTYSRSWSPTARKLTFNVQAVVPGRAVRSTLVDWRNASQHLGQPGLNRLDDQLLSGNDHPVLESLRHIGSTAKMSPERRGGAGLDPGSDDEESTA